jgi:hypothetical protein
MDCTESVRIRWGSAKTSFLSCDATKPAMTFKLRVTTQLHCVRLWHEGDLYNDWSAAGLATSGDAKL